MNNPLVSVIIPVYNGEKNIAQTINSVLEQTYQNLQIIIINDGSTDSTLAIIQEVKNDKIEIINQENKGVSFTKQVGLNHSKGDFIQFLDADDLLSPNKIELQVNALAHKEDYIAICSTIHFNDQENHLLNKPAEYEDRFLFSSDDPTEFLINLYGGNNKGGSMIQPNAFLVPISIIEKIGPWNSSISPCADEDGEYFCRVILASKGIIYVENVFNYYRKYILGKSLSGLKDYRSLFNSYQSVCLKRAHLFQHTADERAKFAIARQLISIAVESFPKHRTLTNQIVNDVKKLGNYSYLPISGGPMAQKFSKIAGWKLARWFQYLIKKK